MSSIRFKDGNRVEADLHFGCSTWIHKDEVYLPAMQEFLDFVFDLYEEDESKWTKHREFYTSMNA